MKLTTWWIIFVHLSRAETTKPPEIPEEPSIIVDTVTGIAEHKLSQQNNGNLEIHYLIETHQTTLNIVYRLPNMDEIKAGAAHANIKCPNLSARIQDLETKYSEAIESLLGTDHHNVGEHEDNKSPISTRIPDLLMNIKKPTSRYGLPLLTPREGRSALIPDAQYTTMPIYEDTTITKPAATSLGESQPTKPKTSSTSTTSTTTTTSTTPTTPMITRTTKSSKVTSIVTKAPTTRATTTKPTQKVPPHETTAPSLTTLLTTTMRTTLSFPGQFKINGKTIIVYIKTTNPRILRQETTSLLTEAFINKLYESIAEVQTEASQLAVDVEVETRSTPVAMKSSRTELSDRTIVSKLGVYDDTIVVINTNNKLTISTPITRFGQGPVRMQIKYQIFEKTDHTAWPTGNETQKFKPEAIITYKQGAAQGSLSPEKMCQRSVTTERYGYAYCIILTQGVFFFSNTEITIEAVLTKVSKLAILSNVSIIWSKPSSQRDKLPSSASTDKARNRRQALIAGGLAGAATVIGVEKWLTSHSSSSADYKDLSKHIADLARNVEKAVEDENNKIIHLDKHVVAIDQQEASLICTESELTVAQISSYIYEKLQLTLTEIQLLGRELESAPEKSRLSAQIKSLCEAYNEKDKTICIYHTSKAKLLDIEHNGTALSAKIVLETPISEKEIRPSCTTVEEIMLPKLTKDDSTRTNIVNTLEIPHRIRISCAEQVYFYQSDAATILSSRSILLRLTQAHASLECNPRIANCPKSQYTTPNTCLRTLYATVTNHEFVAISSTVPITDNEFSTLKALGLHAKTYAKNPNDNHTIKVYNRKPKYNIQISCGENLKTTYDLHKSSNPSEFSIAHISDTTSNKKGQKSLSDIFKEELEDIQNTQLKSEIKTESQNFRNQISLKALNQTKDQIVQWTNSLGVWSIDNAHLWALVGCLFALVIVIIIANKIYKHCRPRTPQYSQPIRRTNNRLSKIYRRSSM